MIKSMDMEFIPIQMEDHIKVSGLTESSMEREYLSPHKAHKEKEYGMKAKESDGSMKAITIILMIKNDYFKFFI